MRDPDFVGADPDSKTEKCPAVFRDPITGDFYQQGRVVTDLATLEGLGEHIGLGEDEAVVWQPASMAHALAQAASGTYERGLHGPGVPTFRELLDGTRRSAVHLEMRDVYDERDPEFAAWRKGEPVGDVDPWAEEWQAWMTSS
ncbi:DUF6879 family protein [Actinomadura sp. KC216]|uniref:DUF6879 family protein n=1 Tax=Actinomadura sp. KC216 TaxID=2530370 RepID=UPI001A9EDD39|nr:DUF6879 family protein [Actinomadura sp. KC216]